MIFKKSLLCDKLVRRYYKDVQTCTRRGKEESDFEISAGTDLETLSGAGCRSRQSCDRGTWADQSEQDEGNELRPHLIRSVFAEGLGCCTW